MKKRTRLVALGVALALLLGLAVAWVAAAATEWPPVKADLSIQQDGNIFTAVVWVKNTGDFDTDTLNVKAQVPKGAKYVDSWAGSGRGFNAGVFDGNDVGWVNPGVKAGARQGPFVYIFDTSALPANSRPYVSAWVSWAAKTPGTALSSAVRIRTPYPYPAAKPSALAGAAVYSANCASCHGATGKGDGAKAADMGLKPPDLTGTAWLREAGSKARPFLHYLTITEGKNHMFKDKLTDGQRWDAMFYTWSLATSPAKLAEGKAIYQQNCAACHGATGKGAGPEAAGKAPFSFAEDNLRWVNREYPMEFFEVVEEGEEGTAMPAWEGILTENQIWNVVDFVRTFSYDPPFEIPTGVAPAARPAAAAAPAAPAAPAAAPTGDAARGSAVFAQSCQACHGAGAAGGVGPALKGAHFVEEHGTLETFSPVVRKGEGIMPAFGAGQISDAQLQDLFAYIRSLTP